METKEVLTEMNEQGKPLRFICQIKQADEGFNLESNYHHCYLFFTALQNLSLREWVNNSEGAVSVHFGLCANSMDMLSLRDKGETAI